MASQSQTKNDSEDQQSNVRHETKVSLSNVELGGRSFYTIPPYRAFEQWNTPSQQKKDKTKLLTHIDDNVVGNSAQFSGPYGVRSVVYCDYTASGRALKTIEGFIQDQVMPMYGNVHTTTTVTSLQSTLYRHEARDIVRNAVKASEYDAVIFVGNGCTGAVHKLINALDLPSPPVVFISPFEHHSNILPWKESGATVIRLPQNSAGLVDSKALETELQKWQSSGRQLIGCFSAASNITGILCDTVAITVLLHKYNALAFWDYATAGPYVDINMNPVIGASDPSAAHKDAIFLSPHKFVGGVDTPGILVAKKRLFKNTMPTGGGGGSVFFVSRESHRYLKQVEMREEGGTPSIIGAVRAGLAFQLKEAVGADVIMKREEELCQRALKRWSSCSNLVLLGSLAAPRLPIFSFMVRHPITNQLLHHNFICAVLNDVFGIQARGGCACAGPYAQDVLGIDEELAQEYEKLLLEEERLDRIHLRRYHESSNREVLRPGFARLNLPYFMRDKCVSFVLDAVAMVAQHGWKLLPQYMFNPETGEWKQTNHQVFQDRRWLGSISYSSGEMYVPPPPAVKPKGPLPESYQECLEFAEEIFTNAEQKSRTMSLPDQTLLFLEEVDRLRWFMLPSEALALMQGKTAATTPQRTMPFEPPSYPLTREEFMNVTIIEGAVHNCIGTPDAFFTAHMDARGSANTDSNSKKSENVEMGGTCKSEEVGQMSDGSNHTKHQGSVSKQEVDVRIQTGRQSFVSSGAEEEVIKSNLNKVQLNGNFSANPKSRAPTEASSVGDDLRTLPEMEAAASFEVEREECENNITKVPLNDMSANKRNGASLAASIAGDKTMDDMSQQNGPLLETGLQSKEQCDSSSNGVEGCVGHQSLTDLDDNSLLQTSYEDTSGALREGSDIHSSEKPERVKFHPPPKRIFKPAVQALEEYQMLVDGDRVLVCLSGGKDSLSLLHTIKQYQYLAKKKGINFQFGAVTVDPQTPSYDPSPLKGYLAELGVPYFYEEQCIIEQAANLEGGCDSICSFCSRIKRGRIYACARREGYNVLAMGQHLDDLAESFFMSVFHNGLLRTMKANYLVHEGDLRVIRPLVYVREKDLREFANKVKLPVIPENCPACFEAPKERHRTKQLLASQEILFPRLYQSLLTAMKPLMAKNKTGMESVHRKKTGNLDEIQM